MKVLSLIAALMLFAPAAHAQSVERVVGTVFSEIERQVIEDYFANRDMPPVDKAGKDASDDDRDRKDDARDDDRDNDDDKKAKKSKKGKGHAKGKGKGKGKSKGLPPGLAKRAELPPGLAKRDTLPPGLAKRDLPDDLKSNLPPKLDGTKRVVVDRDVVLIEEATGIVLDVIRDVLTGKKQ